MSKYYKAEDVINAIEDKIAEYIPTLYGRYAEIPLELRMAIEHLPTIEVSEDCISREYVKSFGYINKGDFNSVETIREWIDNAPSVVPSRAEGEWIPCSERLPDDNREVLISLEWGIDIGTYERGEWRSEWINHYDDDNVLAWMPLPSAYQGE